MVDASTRGQRAGVRARARTRIPHTEGDGGVVALFPVPDRPETAADVDLDDLDDELDDEEDLDDADELDDEDDVDEEEPAAHRPGRFGDAFRAGLAGLIQRKARDGADGADEDLDDDDADDRYADESGPVDLEEQRALQRRAARVPAQAPAQRRGSPADAVADTVAADLGGSFFAHAHPPAYRDLVARRVPDKQAVPGQCENTGSWALWLIWLICNHIVLVAVPPLYAAIYILINPARLVLAVVAGCGIAAVWTLPWGQ